MGGNSPILKRHHNGALDITSGEADGQTEIPIRTKSRNGVERLKKENYKSWKGLDEMEEEGLKKERGATGESNTLGKEEIKSKKRQKSRRLKGEFLLWIMMTSPTLTLTLKLVCAVQSLHDSVILPVRTSSTRYAIHVQMPL